MEAIRQTSIIPKLLLLQSSPIRGHLNNLLLFLLLTNKLTTSFDQLTSSQQHKSANIEPKLSLQACYFQLLTIYRVNVRTNPQRLRKIERQAFVECLRNVPRRHRCVSSSCKSCRSRCGRDSLNKNSINNPAFFVLAS